MRRKSLRPDTAGEAGFSLVELLVVMVVMGIMALWGIPALLGTLQRTRLVNSAKEVAVLMQVARLEAIKKAGVNGDLQNRVTFVNYIPATTAAPGGFEVLIDENPDPADGWNPSRRIGGTYYLPRSITLQFPTEAAEGNRAIRGWDDPGPNQANGPVFRSDGSTVLGGAFTLRNARDQYLEVRVEFPATGKLSIQKWDGTDLNTGWYENHEAGQTWQW